jgi:nucleoid DNA-binding protein
LLKLSKEEKDVVNQLHSLTEVSKANVLDFFEMLVAMIIISWERGEGITIPALGEFKVSEVEEGATPNSKEIKFTPSSFLWLVLDQLALGQKTEVEKIIEEKILLRLTQFINPEKEPDES